MNFHNQNIWLVGASSGIGEALSQELAHRGANLILSARRDEKLNQIIARLQSQTTGNHAAFTLDVASLESLQQATEKIKKSYPVIHRMIFLAAIYQPSEIEKMDMKFTKSMLEVNLLGAMHCVHQILPIFNQQNHGQIAICASVAGYLGLPFSQPYAATKAALINYTESLYSELNPKIDVKLINPGFVATPMTEKNQFDMPMIITADKAAKAIADGLQQKGFEIHFPKRFTRWLKCIAILPYAIQFKITKRLKNKDGKNGTE